LLKSDKIIFLIATAEKMIPMIPKIISLLPSVLFARTSDNLTDHKLKLSIDYDII